MKKVLTIVCAFMMVFVLAACGSGKTAKDSGQSAASSPSAATAVNDFVTSKTSASAISSDASSAAELVMPDLVGKNLGDVSGELKNFDVKYYKADGSRANVFSKSNWRIDAQSIEAGTAITEGARLDLTLGHLTEEKAAADRAEAEAKQAEERADLDYISVSVAQLVDDLDANAMNAKETYKGGYYRITGVVSNIDASGRYIVLDPEGVWYNFTNVQCYLNDDAARDYVRQISTGDVVTLCGQVTEVGEVMGYSIDVYFFE